MKIKNKAGSRASGNKSIVFLDVISFRLKWCRRRLKFEEYLAFLRNFRLRAEQVLHFLLSCLVINKYCRTIVLGKSWSNCVVHYKMHSCRRETALQGAL